MFYTNDKNEILTKICSRRTYGDNLFTTCFISQDCINKIKNEYNLREDFFNFSEPIDNIQCTLEEKTSYEHMQITFYEEFPIRFEKLLKDLKETDKLESFKHHFSKLFYTKK